MTEIARHINEISHRSQFQTVRTTLLTVPTDQGRLFTDHRETA